MYIHKLPSAAACKITVTATATLLNSLIGTAGSTTYNFEPGMNAVDITPEDGDIRILFDGNTPTSANGILLKNGGFYSFRGVPLAKMRLIRVTGDVVCAVQVGRSENDEAGAVSVPSTLSGVTVTVDSEFPAAALLADNAATPTTTAVGAFNMVYDGATWDFLRGTAADGALVNIGALIADDAVFTPATSKVLPIGATADETGTDSIDEGDIGALRMTLNRRLLTASHSTDDAAPETGTRPSVIGALADETATDSVDEGDLGYLRMTLDRRLRVANKAVEGPGEPTIDSYTSAAINLAAGANQVLVAAPGASKQIWVYGINFTVNVAGTVSIQDEDDTAITGVVQYGATGGMAVSPAGNFAMPLWKVATNKALEVDVVTSELDGSLQYAIVSV